MEQLTPAARLIRFGVFELDLHTGELRKSGLKLRLQGQPVEVLKLLLERPGELVTREELEKRLWVGDTVVEFEHSINAAVNRLREALGDSADHPRYVETLARRGYRFIYPVDVAPSPPAESAAPVPAPILSGPPPADAVAAIYDRRPANAVRRYSRLRLALAGGAIVALIAALLALNVAGLRERLMRTVGAQHAVPLQIQSIAVLPLENLSGDPEQEYFADGMTEELITTLGKIGSLRVISRTSVMRFKGARPAGGLPEIAQKLNVDAVVEGSVIRSGDRVRITANLLDARSERHLWAEAYDRDMHDILALQGEVARAIASEIKIKVTPQEQTRLASARPVDPEAHELYLKGSDSLGRDDPKKALEFFQQATNKDPNFARAYLGVAQGYTYLGRSDELAAVEAYAKSKAFARKALELDDSLAEAHVALAISLWEGEWDWSGAERQLKRALEINPNSQVAHSIYSWYLSNLGRHEQAIAEARRALEINPLMAEPYRGLGGAYYFSRRYDEALAQFEKMRSLEQNPNPFTYMNFGWTYREKGMYKEAQAELQQMPDGPIKFGHLGNTYARAGNKAEAREAIRKLVEREAKDRVGTYAVALVYAGLGEKDRAFEWMEKAYKVHDKGMTFFKVDPPLDPLRSDARFQDLLRRMNFPP